MHILEGKGRAVQVLIRPGRRPKSVTVKAWFFARVLKSATCWLWAGYSKNGRYGHLTVGGKSKPAHVVAWELATGEPVPEGLKVLHKCDNTRCVRKGHLFLGTQLDNMRDCSIKGRLKPGGRPFNEARSLT